jgi:hypothetical protein
MDKTLIIVCSVIGSLGLLSAILGFSAEGTKLTVSTADLPFFFSVYFAVFKDSSFPLKPSYTTT